MQIDTPKFIRWPRLKKILDDSVSRATIRRWEIRGIFPKHILLGPNMAAWSYQEIEEWLQSKKSK